MTYKEFVLSYFNEIYGDNSLLSGKVLLENSSDFTCAEDEINVETVFQHNSENIYKSLPQ